MCSFISSKDKFSSWSNLDICPRLRISLSVKIINLSILAESETDKMPDDVGSPLLLVRIPERSCNNSFKLVRRISYTSLASWASIKYCFNSSL